MIPNDFTMHVTYTAKIYRVRINSGDIEVNAYHTNIDKAMIKARRWLDTAYTEKIKKESVIT